ncbi:MAG: glycosyltransferase [Armatimonadetes bacterium]|nr:glycosyltransferase [Armatimonadota bacterium]
MAKITIGVPFYNTGNTLGDTIRSVFAQTFQDWELILLDDGSTDNSLQIAQAVKDSRVRVISDGTNQGIGARRKQIVDLATGDYLAWQDADDLMHPMRLDMQCQFLENNQQVDLVDAWSFSINTNNSVIGLSRLPKLNTSLPAAIKKPIMLNGASLGRVSMYRRDNFDASFRRAEDWEMWIRALQHSVFARIPQPLYFRRSFDEDGNILWRKEFAHLRVSRRVIMLHGPRLIGWRKTASFIAEYYMRVIFRSILCASGAQSLLPRYWRKDNVITEEDKQSAEVALKQIFDTTVPGL